MSDRDSPERELDAIDAIDEIEHFEPPTEQLELTGEPGYDSVHGVYGLTELPIRWTR